MMSRNKLSQAIFWGLAASATTLQAQDEQTNQDERSKEVDRIVVTATKTEEVDLQSAPVTVQAVGEEELAQQNIGNFDDLRNSVPGLNAASRGPGQQTIFIRGMAVQPITVLLSGAQGTQPNVALYLDEQPVTAPGRNLDVYATDLQRIEVLPGPQGTLFGASSQAGTIRYITNKPQLFEFNAGFTADASFTKNGEMNSAGEGFINIPIGDKTAARLTFYNVNYGGYIDNVRGTFTTDPAINSESAIDLGPDATYESTDNNELVEDNFNDSFYKGVRAGIYHEFNRDWNILVQNTYQELGADGVFDYDPEVGDLKVSRFFPDELDDKFNQTSWTVEGRAGMLDLVYTGGYLYREVEQSVDYTGYNNAGAFIAYYTCTYDNPAYIVNYDIDPRFITENRQCLDPTKGVKIKQDHTRNTHEFRISTPAENRCALRRRRVLRRLRTRNPGRLFLPGHARSRFCAECADLGCIPGEPGNASGGRRVLQRHPAHRRDDLPRFSASSATTSSPMCCGPPSVRAPTKSIPDFKGSSNFADGIFQGSVNTDRGRDYDVSGGHRPEPLSLEDVITRFNLSYTPNDSVMLYFTGPKASVRGWNRGGGIPSANPDFPTVSATYDTDDVVNWELGWKITVLRQFAARQRQRLLHRVGPTCRSRASIHRTSPS